MAKPSTRSNNTRNIFFKPEEIVPEVEPMPTYTEPATYGQDLEQSAPVTSGNNLSSKPGKGRPKGVEKVKRTFYLSNTGNQSIEQTAIELGTRGKIRIKDDSELADIALVLLAQVVREPGGVDRIRIIREELNTPAEQAS